MTNTATEGTIRKVGKVFYLTEDTNTLRSQLTQELNPEVSTELQDPQAQKRVLWPNINTDVMIDIAACVSEWTYDVGEYFLRGITDDKGQIFKEGYWSNSEVQIFVAGDNYGCGSSREVASLAQAAIGLKNSWKMVVFAKSFAPIHKLNLINNGVIASSDFSLLEKLIGDEEVPLEDFTRDLDAIDAEIVARGGLVPYNLARMDGEVQVPTIDTIERPMNSGEKIFASHMFNPVTNKIGIPYVKPGDVGFIKNDRGWFHEFTGVQVDWYINDHYNGLSIIDPKIWTGHIDHMMFADELVEARLKPEFVGEGAKKFTKGLIDFCEKSELEILGTKLQRLQKERMYGISHDVELRRSLPGSFNVATDSHTCNVGANNTISYGEGTSAIAGAMVTGHLKATVPESVRYELTGQINQNPNTDGWVTTKDMMHYLLQKEDWVKPAAGRIMEWGGEALASLSMDQRSTITNMATECYAKTGIVDGDDVTVAYTKKHHPDLTDDYIRSLLVNPDEGAKYAETIAIDLSNIRPMVALPGGPEKGMFIDDLEEVPIDHATVGSCTSAKEEDMDLVYRVLEDAKESGITALPDGKTLFIYTASSAVERYAKKQGYWDFFQTFGGIKVMESGCGACINLGPGITRENEVAISNFNRNFEGRNGKGKMYLGNTATVVASALTGKITAYRPGMFKTQLAPKAI